MKTTSIPQTAPYGFGITVPLPYEEALERIRAALQREGFGVLIEIDVKATLKKIPNSSHM